MLSLNVLATSLFTRCDLKQIHLEKPEHCTETFYSRVVSYLRIKSQNCNPLHLHTDLKLVV